MFKFNFKNFLALPGLETTEEVDGGLVLFQKSAFYAFPQPAYQTLPQRIVLQSSPVHCSVFENALACSVI